MTGTWRASSALTLGLLLFLCASSLVAGTVPGLQQGVSDWTEPTGVAGAPGVVATQEGGDRPVYAPFMAAFYLGVQVVATVGTVVFIFVVLLRREEE